ncbi:MAG: hypothetical protein KAQ68_02895 [Clostridiales bacterium]|nr:hypothetical protein [Clostridiales bacterium]
MDFRLKNFNLSFFNNDVNNSGDMQQKFALWAEYRAEITALLDDATNKDTKNILVLGAGKCNDIDLHYLCSRFARIVLSDVDIKSIEDGMRMQGVSDGDRKKIELLEMDYTGLAEAGFFNQLESMIQQKSSANAFVSYIESSIQNIHVCDDIACDNAHFDVVLSCPVYTQLMYTQSEIFLQILNQYQLYTAKDLQKMDHAFIKSMSQVVRHYNALMMSMVSDDGVVIMLTDIIEIIRSEELHNTIGNLLDSQPLDVCLIEKHITKHGLAFAKNGREDWLEKADVITTEYILWPFNDYKSYLVYGAVGKKKSIG